MKNQVRITKPSKTISFTFRSPCIGLRNTYFIKQLRKDFNAPNAKFVVATLGQTKKGAGGNEGKILEAQLAVDGNSGKYPEFKGTVASVYSNPFCHGGASNSHYGGNAETYMDIGEVMGKAMADLLTRKHK